MLDEPQSSPSPRLRERDGVRDRCHWPYAKLVSGANGPDSTMTSRIVPL
jgi:hypothetical protein